MDGVTIMSDPTPDAELPTISWPQVEAVLELLGLTGLYEARRLMGVELTPVNVIVTVDYSATEGPGAYEDHYIRITGEPKPAAV